MPARDVSPWEPLPLIVYGYAIHPLVPASRRDTRFSTRTRMSTISVRSADDRFAHRDVVSLEVGDEIYAFERYNPAGKEVSGVWYRGYVVTNARRPLVNWSSLMDPSSSLSHREPTSEETQQVVLGIFPASHIFVRDHLPDAEGRLAGITAAYEKAHGINGHGHQQQDQQLWSKDSPMESLREEDEDRMTRKSFRIAPPPEQANSSRAALTVYPPSVQSRSSSPSPTETNLNKPSPPRPTLKSSDETASGAIQPIVDEIASALREWHLLMYQYLARRDYSLFHTVKDHLEALHLGRRQLLAQTLSDQETIRLRRECVARLVRGNIVQGLDIIVRHPVWGALVTVNVDTDPDTRSWMSAVRMYALSVSLAFQEIHSETTLSSARMSTDTLTYGPAATPTMSSFPEITMPKGSSLGTSDISALSGTGQHDIPSIAKVTKFYHVFVDVRAFVASLCSPGETAELFFSLYNKAESHFITEEFCAVLNHNGVLARNPSAKIRSLFVDLVESDAQDPIFLVCRIVRNGSLKLGSTFSTGVPDGSPLERRASQASFRDTHVNSPPPSHIMNGAGRMVQVNDSPYNFRRPFGCAVLELTQLSSLVAERVTMSATKEFTMPIWVPSDEAAFAMVHNDIIANNTKELIKSPRAESVAVTVKVFHGDADVIVRENSSLLQDVPVTMRLGFPDVVFPGDKRNEVYVKLWSGDFSAIHTGNSRLSMVGLTRGSMGPPSNNIEITVEVRDGSGRTLDTPVISMGSGEPTTNRFHSMIFQKNNQPTFGELFKIVLPSTESPHWHLFFTFRNRVTREGRATPRAGDTDKPFAFAYLPLFPQDRTFLEDGGHTLVLYRADKLVAIPYDLYRSASPWLAANQGLESISITPDMQRTAPPLRDTVTLRTSLCSTRFTQDAILFTLLNWREVKDEELLSAILGKFTFVAETIIVKFLGDVFDALFGILTSRQNQYGSMDQLILNGLVTVLGIVQDRRFRNFLPVLDVYIEKHFNHPAAGLRLIYALNRSLSEPNAENASSLRAALKVWNYLFKVIGRSLELQRMSVTQNGGGSTNEVDGEYHEALSVHLGEINRLMSYTTPVVIGTQTIALQHFTAILPQLRKVFSSEELVDIALAFVRSNPSTKGKIVIYKLIALLHLAKGFLFEDPGSRTRLVEDIVSWIKPYFGRFDEYAQAQEGENAIDAARIGWLETSRLCVTIIAVMLDKLQECLVNPKLTSDPKALRKEQENVDMIVPLLPKLLTTYLEFESPASHQAIGRSRSLALISNSMPVTFPESYPFSLIARLPSTSPADKRDSLSSREGTLFNAGLGETAIVILVLATSALKTDLHNSLTSTFDVEGKEHTTHLLNQIFQVATSILDNNAFPANWLNVNILAHVALIRLMDPIADILETYYIPTDDADGPLNGELWRMAISTLLKLLSSEQLVIEDLSPQRGRTVWRLAGDIRGDGATVLLNLWNALGMPEQISAQYGAVARFGAHQVALNSLVDHVVHLCLSHHDQLRVNAVQILYSMIISEYQASENFNEIENEIVSKLDSLFMSNSKGDETARSFFVGQLRHLFDISQIDDRLRDRVHEFLESVDSFLELLLSVRALPDGEEFADDRVIATLRLMNYLRRSGRDDMYIKYVHQLVNMHIQSQNYVEAALTLQLHADLHTWDLHSFVPAMDDLGLPRQSQFHRKETLCLLILDYLGKGKAWEKAIDLCKELAEQHQEVSYNFSRLSEILKHQATLLDSICNDVRYYPDYFRVTFFGSNFPAAVRNKSIVYRGYEWEKFGAFCERMLNKHVGTQLLKGAGDPPPDIRFGNDQYIQIVGVTPEPNRDLPIFSNPNASTQIKAYYEHNATNIFSFSRPLVKYARDGSEEAWTEKTYLTTEAAFPTVLRRSEVVQTQAIYISPIESALADLEQKTRELAGLYMRYTAVAQTGNPVSTNPFSMTLNSFVDAPSDSGIALWRRTFLSPEYLSLWPDRANHVETLRKVIDEHVMTLETCLRLHGRVCPPEMLPFHETLESFFRKSFTPEIRRLAADGLSEFDYANSIAPSTVSNNDLLSSVYPTPAQSSSKHSISSVSTSRAPFTIPPLQLGSGISSPISPSLRSGRMSSQDLFPETPSTARPTPLKRHLQHLAKHGLNGVSSTGERTPPDARSPESPTGSGSFINVVPALNASVPHPASGSNSLKSRLSRLGNSLRYRD